MRIILTFVVFMCLYGPRTKVLDIMVLACTLLASLNFITRILSRKVPKIFLYFTIVIIINFAIFSIHYLHFNTGDPTYLGFIFKYLIYFYAADFIVKIYRSKYKEDFKYFLALDIIKATSINAIFVICMFFLPSFQHLMMSFLDFPKQEGWINVGHRVSDISLGGGAVGSFVFSIVILIGLSIPREYRFNGYFYVITTIVFAASLMGRTGLYFSLIFILIYIFKQYKSFINIKKITYGGIARYFMFLFFILPISLYFILSKLDLESAYFQWITQGITGDNKTAEALQSMWIMPSVNTSLIIGDGNFGRIPPNLIYSDIGYVRIFHSTGALGLILIYGTILSFGFFNLRYFKRIFEFNLENISFLIVVLIFLMNFKELHLAARGSFLLLFIFVLITFYSNKDSLYSLTK